MHRMLAGAAGDLEGDASFRQDAPQYRQDRVPIARCRRGVSTGVGAVVRHPATLGRTPRASNGFAC